MRGNNLHEFSKGKSSVINLTVLCDELTEYMDERKMEVPVDGTYLGFCKAFYAQQEHCVLAEKKANAILGSNKYLPPPTSILQITP